MDHSASIKMFWGPFTFGKYSERSELASGQMIGVGFSTESRRLKRHKVVVIEDETCILEVIDYNLTREGFEVIPCRD
jgi:hypothetical protein